MDAILFGRIMVVPMTFTIGLVLSVKHSSLDHVGNKLRDELKARVTMKLDNLAEKN
jgi:hypothetical protein